MALRLTRARWLYFCLYTVHGFRTATVHGSGVQKGLDSLEVIQSFVLCSGLSKPLFQDVVKYQPEQAERRSSLWHEDAWGEESRLTRVRLTDAFKLLRSDCCHECGGKREQRFCCDGSQRTGGGAIGYSLQQRRREHSRHVGDVSGHLLRGGFQVRGIVFQRASLDTVYSCWVRKQRTQQPPVLVSWCEARRVRVLKRYQL